MRIHRIGLPFLAVILSSLFGACAAAGPAPVVPALVSSRALAAVVIADPAAFLDTMNQFWKSSGLGEVIGADPKTAFESELPFAAVAEKSVDPHRPWVLQILPSDKPDASPSFVVELPYAGDPSALSDGFAKQGLKEIGRDSGYIAFSDGAAPLQFPPTDPADLRILARWPAASLAVWMDPAKLSDAGSLLAEAESAARGGGKDSPPVDANRPFQRAFRSSPGSAEASVNADEREAADALNALSREFKPELSDLSLAIVPSRSTIALRVAARLAPGSRGSGLLAEAARAPSALPWSTKLPADALMSFSWTTDQIFVRDIDSKVPDLLGRFFDALGLSSDKDARAILDGLRPDPTADEWLRALGDRGCLSLDLDPAAATSAIAAADRKDMSALSALVPIVSFTAETRDSSSVARLMKTSIQGDSIRRALDAAGQKGPKLAFSADSTGDGDGATGSFALRLASPGADPDLDAALGPIFEASTFRWLVSPRLLLVGNESIDSLDSRASGTAPSPTLSRSPAFISLARLIPAGSQFVMTVSTSKSAAFAKGAIESANDSSTTSASSSTPDIDPSRFGLLAAWLLAEAPSADSDGGRNGPLAEAGLALQASDLGSLGEILSEIFVPREKTR